MLNFLKKFIMKNIVKNLIHLSNVDLIIDRIF